MRPVPMMRVEVDGKTVSRPGVLEILQYDSAGKPTMSRMRPDLLPGEVLIERLGQIPVISNGTSLSDLTEAFRHQAIRAVTGEDPAMLAKVADLVALDCLCRRLSESAMAFELLRNKGYGRRGDSLVDMIKTLPKAARKA